MNAGGTQADRLRPWLMGLVLVGATFAAYSGAIHGEFIWDDNNYVTANPTLRSLEGLWRIWFEPRSTPQYYPLTFSTLWVEYQLWGLDPFGYHVTNVLLHALNALLFWRVLVWLDVPGAWLAGAVFALHPIHVESVAWITERKNVLSGAVYLGAALAYFRFSPPGASPRGHWLWCAVSLVLFSGALLSKTVTCSLPAALLLVSWWKRGSLDRRDLVALAPFFVLGLAGALTTVWLEREHVGAQGPEWAFSLVERVLIAGRILCFYVATLLWPSNLAFMYPRWQIDAGAWWQYAFPVVATVAVGGVWGLRHRWGRGPLIAALFYAGTLVPALGFFNVYPMRYSFVADHFAYLATLGPIALLAAVACNRADALAVGVPLRRFTAAALLAVLGVLSWRQGQIYLGPEALWTDTVAKNPTGWAVRVNLGGVYADTGRQDEAIAEMQAAVDLWPSAPEPHNALGAMWEQQGELERAEAAFRQALRLESRYYEAHTNMGLILIDMGRLDEALSHLKAAMVLKPEYVEGYYHAAVAHARLGNRAEAVRHFADTLLRVPHHADAHSGLCGVLVEQRRIDDALHHCQEALRLRGDHPEAHENAARALRARGRAEDARRHDAAASEARKRLAGMHRDFALRIAGDGRPRAAIAHLVEALRYDPDDAVVRARLEQLRAEQG